MHQLDILGHVFGMLFSFMCFAFCMYGAYNEKKSVWSRLLLIIAGVLVFILGLTFMLALGEALK